MIRRAADPVALFQNEAPLTLPPDPADDPAARLLERVRREGPVLPLPGGVVGIFSPALANQVDKINSDDLKVIESLADVLKLRQSEPVTWREVRALLTERSGALVTPEQMRALHRRMQSYLLEHGAADAPGRERAGQPPAGREHDLTGLMWRTVSRALIPLAIDGIDGRDLRTLIAEQELRFRIQLEQHVPLWRRIPDFMLHRAATRVINRQIKRRVAAGEARDDFTEPLLGLVDRIGVDRVTYLVTVQLIAISGVPGMMAACLVYAMTQYPHWHERLREEVDALEWDELYTLPIRKLPCTMRFIKEAMRLWTTPFVTRRVAQRDIELDGVSIRKDQIYELSSYILHHSEEYWDEPEVFDPDRWLASRRQQAKGAYVPFGFGPRSCVGASVGHAQLVLFCAMMARDMRVEPNPARAPWMRKEGFAVPTDFFGTVTPRRR